MAGNFRLSILVQVFLFYYGSSGSNHGFCERYDNNGYCTNNDEDGPCWFDEQGKNLESSVSNLVRLEPYEIGHEQEMDINDKTYKIITRALKPVLFEIPEFVDDEEIKTIIDQAHHYGMFNSKAKGGLTPRDFFKPSDTPGKSLGPAGDFYNWDINEDNLIDMADILHWNKFYNFLVMNETDVHEMFDSLNITDFDDGIITPEEFENMNTQGIEDYLNLLLREHPRFRQRYSEQTWLQMGKIYSDSLHRIRERVVSLTKLPRKIVYGGENMQVVKYGPYGHYNAHHDSETDERRDVPCCHHTDYETIKQYGKCKLCRFITIMIYLNDVEEGGETAFPAAHNDTYDSAGLRIRGDESVVDYLNLSNYCYNASLVITPKRGTAIMWYNHQIDPRSGWLGEMEAQSLHGGCDVKKGEKWIANIWLTAPYADSVDKKSMYFNEEDYSNTEKEYNHH